ncbi:hypothetical protein YC2023_080633 [Brassica napus]
MATTLAYLLMDKLILEKYSQCGNISLISLLVSSIYLKLIYNTREIKGLFSFFNAWIPKIYCVEVEVQYQRKAVISKRMFKRDNRSNRNIN